MVFLSVSPTAFLLAFSLVLLIRDSFALTLQQVRKDLDGNVVLDVAGRNSANIAKEAYDHGFPVAVADDGNIRLERRKMMSKGPNLVKKTVKADNMDAKEAKEAKISGNASNNQPGSSLEHLEYQTVNHGLPTTNQLCSESFKPANSDGSGGSECPSMSEKPVLQNDSDNLPFQELEAGKLLEAAEELGNLLNEDYRGGGGSQRSPPINNNQPLDQQHAFP